MLAAHRGRGIRIVRELPCFCLGCSKARLVEATRLQHSQTVDGGDGGVDEEVPVLAVVVEPDNIAWTGTVGAEAAKFGTAPLTTAEVGIRSSGSLTATPNSLGQHCVNSVEAGAAATTRHVQQDVDTDAFLPAKGAGGRCPVTVEARKANSPHDRGHRELG